MKARTMLSMISLLCMGAAAGAQETKTFPEASCSYTLSDKSWKWVDPEIIPAQVGVGKLLVFATDRNGVFVKVSFDPLKPGYQPNQYSYTSFEQGFLQNSKMKKHSAQHRLFRGVPSYQINMRNGTGVAASILIMYANDNFYEVSVIKATGTLDPQSDVEPILQGFNFTVEPRPMAPQQANTPASSGGSWGLIALGTGAVCVLGLVAVGAMVLLAFLLLPRKSRGIGSSASQAR